MKIEKINEDQIKITIGNDELRKRNIEISEIAFSNPEKISNFFKDIVEQAMTECNFYTEINTPLFIEILSVASENIMLIVTKTAANQPLNLLPQLKPARQFKRAPLTEQKRQQKSSQITSSSVHTFSFEKLDELASACQEINLLFHGKSSIYKLNNKYYLMLTFKRNQILTNVVNVLNEYGQNISASHISLPYLSEYGELLIGKNAVKILSEYFA